MVRENALVIKMQKGEPEIAKKRGFYLGVPQVAFSCSREGWHPIKALCHGDHFPSHRLSVVSECGYKAAAVHL